VTDSTPIDKTKLLRRLSRDSHRRATMRSSSSRSKTATVPRAPESLEDEKAERHRYFQELFRLQGEL